MFNNFDIVKIIAAVGQSVRVFTSQAEGWVFESQPWQTLVVKQVVIARLLNARQQVWVSRVPWDDHYKRWNPVSHSRCGMLKNPHSSGTNKQTKLKWRHFLSHYGLVVLKLYPECLLVRWSWVSFLMLRSRLLQLITICLKFHQTVGWRVYSVAAIIKTVTIPLVGGYSVWQQ